MVSGTKLVEVGCGMVSHFGGLRMGVLIPNPLLGTWLFNFDK